MAGTAPSDATAAGPLLVMGMEKHAARSVY